MTWTSQSPLAIFDLDGTLIEFHRDEVTCPICDGSRFLSDWEPCLACLDGIKTFHSLEDYHRADVLPGRQEVLHALHEAGVKLAIATNQTDIGFGRITWDDVERKIDTVEMALFQRFEWSIATGHPGAPWPFNDNTLVMPRKPDESVLLALTSEIDHGPVVFVGDTLKDRTAADHAVIPFLDAEYFFRHGGWGRWLTSVS